MIHFIDIVCTLLHSHNLAVSSRMNNYTKISLRWLWWRD